MPPVIRPPVSPIASQTQTRTVPQGNAPAGVTVISRDRRFTLTASKASPVQEPLGNRSPDMADLARSLGLELGATKKQTHVYTRQAAADEEQSQAHDGNPPAGQ